MGRDEGRTVGEMGREATARPATSGGGAASVRARDSAWRVHEFEVWSGGALLCRCSALRTAGQLLLWLGGPAARELGQLACGVPGPGVDGARGGAASSTALLGAEAGAPALARRLAALLARPVFVCAGAAFDRFTLPLVEQGLVAEIRRRPECF